jgi:hypothetical protein
LLGDEVIDSGKGLVFDFELELELLDTLAKFLDSEAEGAIGFLELEIELGLELRRTVFTRVLLDGRGFERV